MNDFNIYLPQTKVILKEDKVKKALNEITVDIRERLNGYIVKLNHQFALDNYDYVINEVSDKTIQDIYKVLGPFDHYAYHEFDDDLDTQRTMKTEFEYRRSGAKYRGQINMDTLKQDGIGFKTYPNGAMFEGFFEEGQIHGYGRGITSRGEVY